MNLTIEQLSKATKLSVSTLRVYASQMNLGKKVGNKRVYSQADVQKLLQGPKKSPAKKPTKSRAKKAKASANAAKAKRTATTTPTPDLSQSGTLNLKPPRVSFLSRLFSPRKPQKKVGLMEARKASLTK